MGVFYIFVL